MLTRVISSLLLIASLCPAEDAADWQDVQQLEPGTVLTINTERHQYCRLIRVTDSSIECAQLLRSSERLTVFQRTEVRQVRLAVPKPTHQLRDTLIGAAVGETLGIVWAHAVIGSHSSGAKPATLALAGVPEAKLIGSLAHTMGGAESFRDGPIIYTAP